MEETTPSGSASETQAPPSTAKVTPAAPASEMQQQKPDATVEELKARIAELEHSHSNAKEELGRHWKKLAAYEKQEKEAEAARKAAEEAQLSELERTQKQFSELQAQHSAYMQQMQDRIVRYEVEKQAHKLGVIDPDAAAKLLDWSELEYEEDGTPKNAEKLLEKLLKNKPYLAPPAKAEPPQGQAAPAQTAEPAQPRAPAIPPFAGRSSIPSPGGTTPPGKMPTLDDYYRSQRR